MDGDFQPWSGYRRTHTLTAASRARDLNMVLKPARVETIDSSVTRDDAAWPGVEKDGVVVRGSGEPHKHSMYDSRQERGELPL